MSCRLVGVTLDVVENLAYRGDGTGRPSGVFIPPSTAPMVHGSTLRKYWRYVGLWGPEMSIAAAQVRVGPLVQEFWAVWQREAGVLHQRTHLSSRRVATTGDRLVVRDGRVAINLELIPVADGAIEVVTPVGAGWTWTRKVAARATGQVHLNGIRHDIDAAALIDDNGGFHPRRTHWRWAAGAGTLADGRTALWNAVVGLNDRPPHQENTIWIDGVPQQIGLVRISGDLTTTTFDDGYVLNFSAEVERSLRTNLVVLRSTYRSPFGSFAGVLPGGLELVDGYGVMEDHQALW